MSDVTEPKKQPRYELVYDKTHTNEQAAIIDRDQQAELFPASLYPGHRVRMRRHRRGAFRVWVRSPLPEKGQ